MGLRTMTDADAVPTDLDVWFRDAYPRLRRFAAVVAPPTIDPDDLIQDALVRVLGAGTPSSTSTILRRICAER